MTLDPLTHAVRDDLADVRLAELVFAPHYAAPVPYRVVRPATLRVERSVGSRDLCELAAGDVFEVLDLVTDYAWGVAPGHSRVGWIDRAALGVAA